MPISIIRYIPLVIKNKCKINKLSNNKYNPNGISATTIPIIVVKSTAMLCLTTVTSSSQSNFGKNKFINTPPNAIIAINNVGNTNIIKQFINDNLKNMLIIIEEIKVVGKTIII